MPRNLVDSDTQPSDATITNTPDDDSRMAILREASLPNFVRCDRIGSRWRRETKPRANIQWRANEPINLLRTEFHL